MPVYRKTATEIVDLVMNWETALDSGDSIVTSAWSVPTGITASNLSSTAYTTSLRLSSGTTGRPYALINTVTLTSGQKYQAPLSVTIGG